MKKLSTILLLFLFLDGAFTQTIVRSSINSLGNNSNKNNGIVVSHSAGQASVNQSHEQLDFYFCPGFQQGFNANRQEKIQDFSLFPNPASKSFNIHSTSENNFSYYIVDQTGKVIQKETVNNLYYKEVQVTDFAAGLYQLFIFGVDFKFSFKLFID